MPFLLRTLATLALLVAGCRPAPLFPQPADAPAAVPVVAMEAAGAIGPNVRVVASGGGFYETSIAFSRTDPRRMVIGVIGPLASTLRTNYVFTSTDGAQTWTTGAPMRLDATNEKIYSRYGDPVIAADRDGRFYHAGLILQGEPGKYKLSGIGVSHSDDGIGWSQPVIVTEIDKADSPAFDDKEWLAVDDTIGPFGGSVYLLWQKMERLPSAPGVVYFARSRDRGVTWETPVALTSMAMSGTCLIDVGPQGEIHIAYYRDPEGMVSRVSWDGGETFSAPVNVLPEGLFGGAVEGTSIQFAGFPHLIADRSRSAHGGNAYFVHVTRGWRSDGTIGKAIGISRSMDRGRTWSAAKNISNAPAGDSFFPMAAVDRVTGEIVVAWYDTREAPGTTRARIYASRSSDGGETFTPPLAVSEELSIATAWMGDYYTLAAHDGTWIAAFSDGAGRLYVADVDLGQAKARAPRRRPTRR